MAGSPGSRARPSRSASAERWSGASAASRTRAHLPVPGNLEAPAQLGPQGSQRGPVERLRGNHGFRPPSPSGWDGVCCHCAGSGAGSASLPRRNPLGLARCRSCVRTAPNAGLSPRNPWSATCPAFTVGPYGPPCHKNVAGDPNDEHGKLSGSLTRPPLLSPPADLTLTLTRSVIGFTTRSAWSVGSQLSRYSVPPSSGSPVRGICHLHGATGTFTFRCPILIEGDCMSTKAEHRPWKKWLDLQPVCTGYTMLPLRPELPVAAYHTWTKEMSGVNPLSAGAFTATRACMP